MILHSFIGLFDGLTLGEYIVWLFLLPVGIVENMIYGDWNNSLQSWVTLFLFYIPAALFVLSVVFIVSLIRKRRRRAKDKDGETDA